MADRTLDLVPEDELDFGCTATHTVDFGCGVVCHLDPGHDGDHHDKWAGLVWRTDDGLDDA